MARQGGNKFSKEKYQERILNELNSFLRRDVADPRLVMVSITSVQLTKDYSLAKVFWDTFQDDKREEASKAIQSVAGRLRTLLAKTMDVRQVPELKFIYNSQFEDEKKIAELLDNDDSDGEDS